MSFQKNKSSSLDGASRTGARGRSSDKPVLRGLAATAILSAVAAAGCMAYATQQHVEPARNNRAPVVGNMGGVPMKMPWHFAEWAEYEGEPTWAVRKGSVPVRTLDSNFVSFGFKVRYPDMAELTTPELVNEFKTVSTFTTMWIRVGIGTGSHFGADGALDRRLEGKLADELLKYQPDSQPQYGLNVYRPSRIAPSLSKGALLAIDNDIFVHRDAAGRVNTLIICSNVKHDAATCSQRTKLNSDTKAWLTLSYRRALLSDWELMASKVHNTVMKYRVRANPAAPASAAIPKE